LQIENNVEIYARQGGGWTCDPANARTDAAGQAVRLKPSEINHGNVTPSFRHKDDAKKSVLNHGGVTLAYAEQQTVLSLAALRRLRFPVKGAENADIVDSVARTVLAALGLAAI
jgi:CRISPR-associated protein Csb1